MGLRFLPLNYARASGWQISNRTIRKLWVFTHQQNILPWALKLWYNVIKCLITREEDPAPRQWWMGCCWGYGNVRIGRQGLPRGSEHLIHYTVCNVSTQLMPQQMRHIGICYLFVINDGLILYKLKLFWGNEILLLACLELAYSLNEGIQKIMGKIWLFYDNSVSNQLICLSVTSWGGMRHNIYVTASQFNFASVQTNR